jgi:hypothetical protein
MNVVSTCKASEITHIQYEATSTKITLNSVHMREIIVIHLYNATLIFLYDYMMQSYILAVQLMRELKFRIMPVEWS